jgi:hypothetical protein
MANINTPRLAASNLWGEAVQTDAEFFDDFTESSFSTTADVSRWLVTMVDTDTGGGEVWAQADDFDIGGWFQLTKNANAADLTGAQVNGHQFRIKEGKDIYFEARIAIGDVSEVNLVLGLASADTDMYAGMNDFIGFRMDNDGILDYVVEDDTNETSASTGVTFSDATDGTEAHVVAFYVRYAGNIKQVKFYVDGALKATVTSNIPDDDTDLTVSIENGKGPASVESIYCDYIYAAQKRAS